MHVKDIRRSAVGKKKLRVYTASDANWLIKFKNGKRKSKYGISQRPKRTFFDRARCHGLGPWCHFKMYIRHRHSDILMEVPFVQEKWPCLNKNEIPGPEEETFGLHYLGQVAQWTSMNLMEPW